MSGERLHKILARAGIASRRRAEDLMAAGRVRVNGRVVREPGARADPLVDRIEVDGVPLPRREDCRYLLLNKPRGYLSTVRDPHGRRTVLDLVPPGRGRLYPVGRLDQDTEGLLLLTDDGELTLALTHPRYGVAKTYLATVEGRPGPGALRRLRDGVPLEEGLTRPARVRLLGPDPGGGTCLEITLREGRKRQVRRMLAGVGHRVLALRRVALGPLRLGTLAPGEWRHLSAREVESLWKAVRGCAETKEEDEEDG